MSLELAFQIQLESDYHVGAGHGLGTEVDSALLRDADGVPVLRGTVLNGLLRDGLWRLLQQEPMRRWRRCQESGLSEAELMQRREQLGLSPSEIKQRYCGQYTAGDAVLCPICRLFGTPRTMKRWRIGSARPSEQESLLGTDYKPDEIGSQRVVRVRVNPRTRRAAPRQLFSQEHGGQWTFKFTATCLNSDEAALDEAALLVAAARFVRQLGRSRRRGQGECLISLTKIEGLDETVDLVDNPQARLLQRFEDRWLCGNLQTLAEPGRKHLDGACTGRASGEPVRLWLLARADEPLLIARRASAGNQFQSQPMITGKTLRGALAARAAEVFDLRRSGATYDAFVHLFLRGGVCFPTLYPMFRDEAGRIYPAAPLPRDGFVCKVHRDHPIQWGTEHTYQLKECGECKSPVKGVREEFCVLRKSNLERFRPEMRSEMHIQVAPQKGRVEQGRLFDYVALEPGQYFSGELVCSDEDAWGLLKELSGLEEKQPIPLRLGKGTRRGYGKVTLWLERLESNPHVWVRQSLEERLDEGALELTLTLLTDAVVVDRWGRFVTGFEDEWLSQELRCQVALMKEPRRDFAATKLVDGFNVQLRLPRWRDVALAAGSSVRLKVLGQPEDGLVKRLREVERDGIGLRRNEGYGQVSVNHPIYEDCKELSGTRIIVDDSVELALKGGKTSRKFKHNWEKVLAQTEEDRENPWEQCCGDPFLALARWLDAHRYAEMTWLLTEIDNLGQPDDQLKEGVGGDKEYGARDKPPRLAGAGFELVKDLLRQLQKRQGDRVYWPLGIRMLADRLADFAGQKEEER